MAETAPATVFIGNNKPPRRKPRPVPSKPMLTGG